MTADVTVLRPVLPMTTFLTGNDVPKEYQTRACAAFALWLEQLGDGNAPLALLHMAEALKAEQRQLADTQAQLAEANGRARALQSKIDRCAAHIREGQQLRPDEPDGGLEALVVGWTRYHGDQCGFKARLEAVEALVSGSGTKGQQCEWPGYPEDQWAVRVMDVRAALSGGVV